MAWQALGLLVVALVAVVLLAKSFTPFIQAGALAIGAPEAVVGVVVAAIVLLPEAMAAVRLALADRLQGSINLALGSGVASIGLTIPAVAAVSWWTGVPLELGVSTGGAVLLGLSFMMALITYGTGRASLLSGVVHIVLFLVWLFLLFAP
jgi:Ca2+:H+ antiporter